MKIRLFYTSYMNLRLKIARRLGLGLGFLTVIYLINAYLINLQFSRSQIINDKIMNVYSPSMYYLDKLEENLSDVNAIFRKAEISENTISLNDRKKVIGFRDKLFPDCDGNIISLIQQWPEKEQKKYREVKAVINDSLISWHTFVLNQLTNPKALEQPLIRSEVHTLIGIDGKINGLSEVILNRISRLQTYQNLLFINARKKSAENLNKINRLFIFSVIAFIILAMIISFFTIRSMVVPINYLKDILISMGKGILPKEKIKEGNDEIGEMSVALNTLVKGLKDISDFSIEIGKRNFNSTFTPLSDQDILGNSLIKMREELKKAGSEEEKRKIENAQRNWATQGLAKFSEILRQHSNNLEEFSYTIISNMVRYLEANQGGFFILNNDVPNNATIEMIACYAYDRKKNLEKKLSPGEGLIGRCVKERETIILTDIPKDYIKISSGLGEENPRSLLIVPLMFNGDVYGALEIASFKSFETYQIEFIKKLGESIASTLSTVRKNIQTEILLERSKQQAEQMIMKEQTLRYSMEELRNIQEKSAKNEAELKKEIDELKKKR